MRLHQDSEHRNARAGQTAATSGGLSGEKPGGVKPGWRQSRAVAFKATQLKPLTYSVMHLLVAVSVAYALTRDWRIALGVGIIEPMVQTVAYTLHEAAWAKGLKKKRA